MQELGRELKFIFTLKMASFSNTFKLIFYRNQSKHYCACEWKVSKIQY